MCVARSKTRRQTYSNVYCKARPTWRGVSQRLHRRCMNALGRFGESDSALRTRPRIEPWLSSAGDALPRGRLRRGRAQHVVDTEEAVQDQAEPPVTEGEDHRRVELIGL